MATATINWVPTNGSGYEIWYGKLTMVGTTFLPPSTGWIQAPGSPFDSTLGTATINGLDDNTQYRIVTRADCTSADSPWIDKSVDKIVCPTFTVVANPVGGTDVGASITANISLSNIVEFGLIVSSVTLTVKKTSDSSVAATKVFSAPYTDTTLTNTFTSLLTNTSYTVYLTLHDSVNSVDVTCTNHAVTTLAFIPPPTCTAPTFSISNITQSSALVTITSTLLTGDTYDISINGGSSYVYTGLTGATFSLTGLTQGTNYVVVVRRNCAAGNQGISTSQTFTTASNIIPATIQANRSNGQINTGGGPRWQYSMVITFQQPTPFPITIYFGQSVIVGQVGGGQCRYSQGYDMYTPPTTGPIACCFGGCTYPAPNSNKPWRIDVPAGVVTYTVPFDTAFRDGVTHADLQQVWCVQEPVGTGAVDYISDLWMKITAPSGYFCNFTPVPGAHTSGITIHNL